MINVMKKNMAQACLGKSLKALGDDLTEMRASVQAASQSYDFRPLCRRNPEFAAIHRRLPDPLENSVVSMDGKEHDAC